MSDIQGDKRSEYLCGQGFDIGEDGLGEPDRPCLEALSPSPTDTEQGTFPFIKDDLSRVAVLGGLCD
jgi:hypothetical protein